MQDRPKIILDIGVNYCDLAKREDITDFEAAKLMVDLIAEVVPDDWKPHVAVKFQWYSAEKLAKRTAKPYWDTNEEKSPNQFELFEKYGDKLPLLFYEHLERRCRTYKMEFMCTAFDVERLRAIDQFVETHKIASGDITNCEMLEAVNKLGKPVVLSTGAASIMEIDDARAMLKDVETTLMHCVLRYPTPIADAQLWKILRMNELMGATSRIGYSDHCLPSSPALITAYTLGATVLEKHITAMPNQVGNDHYHAISIKDLPLLLRQLDEVRQLMGDKDRGFEEVLDNQKQAIHHARRGVYLKRDLELGHTIVMDDVEFLRPQGDGMTPMQFTSLFAGQTQVIGRTMQKGEQLQQFKMGDYIHG